MHMDSWSWKPMPNAEIKRKNVDPVKINAREYFHTDG
jgi:hypothetical protein